jgi:hypothetical protein
VIRQPTYGEQNLAHEEPFACVVYRREGVFDRPFKSDGDYTSFTVGLDRYQRLCGIRLPTDFVRGIARPVQFHNHAQDFDLPADVLQQGEIVAANCHSQ